MRKRFSLLFILTAACTGALCAWLLVGFHNLPAVDSLQEYQPSGITRVLDQNGAVIGEVFSERRIPVSLEEIPLTLRQAVLAIEDAQFYEHPGISLRGILRAALRNFVRGRSSEGGSTLTQQLSKVLFLTPEKSLIRKFKEMILSFQIENNYSKDEILELYLNQIYLGDGNYGAQAAAHYYFCKPLDQLNLAEMASLAAIPKGPSIYAPTKNLPAHLQRRNLVLQAMLNNKFIDEVGFTEAKQSDLLIQPCPSPGLRNHVTAMLLSQIDILLPEERLRHGRLEIQSTLNGALQNSAESAVKEGIRQYHFRHPKVPSPVYNDPEAALVAIDASNGEVRALVGGSDFRRSQFNRAFLSRRQPGSSFKPFVYAMALQEGYSQASILQDAPLKYQGIKAGESYNPDNYTRKFLGPTSLRVALELSLNSIPLQLGSRLGVGNIQRFATQLGFASPQPNDLTIALGSGAVTLWEITSAYGAFFNRGVRAEPHLWRHVKDQSGASLLQESVKSQEVMPEAIAAIMGNMLRGVVTHGSAQSLKELSCEARGKTGTSDANRDAWFIGALGNLVIGVWVGYDDNRSLGKTETGTSCALPIWKTFATKVCTELAVAGNAETLPAGVNLQQIDRSSGQLATPRCDDAVAALFLNGTEPQELCKEEL